MNIVIAVTGSIAAYKSYDIVRGLVKEGHQVKVITSKGALEFIQPKTFQYLGAETVYGAMDDFELSPGEKGVRHVDLVKWLDQLVIVPASANTLAKIANGFCDDLLSSVFLALGNKPCTIFPAMNTNMLNHPATQKNLTFLENMKNIFIHPTESGELACGDVGAGKLPAVELITTVIPLLGKQKSKPRKVVITTGATIAPLDPVRYLTNPSTGLTGLELAKSFIANGDNVTLIHGVNVVADIYFLQHLPGVKLIEAKTTQQMLTVAQEQFKDADLYISAAAISDIEFDHADDKIKKSQLDTSLKIKKAPDVLGNILNQKQENQIVISFAAETDVNESTFKEKWERKKVSLLVGNEVHSGHNSEQKGFGAPSNHYYFVQEGKITMDKHLSKQELAKEIVNFSDKK
jgi:phosphopantothenoylcysteine decarboxylase/phosphopantothenate--cysteine ligase